jgi:hypothetical protein
VRSIAHDHARDRGSDESRSSRNQNAPPRHDRPL